MRIIRAGGGPGDLPDPHSFFLQIIHEFRTGSVAGGSLKAKFMSPRCLTATMLIREESAAQFRLEPFSLFPKRLRQAVELQKFEGRFPHIDPQLAAQVRVLLH